MIYLNIKKVSLRENQQIININLAKEPYVIFALVIIIYKNITNYCRRQNNLDIFSNANPYTEKGSSFIIHKEK